MQDSTIDLETLARDHLRSYVHGFAEWPDDDFLAAIDRNGTAVARHEQDHTAHPDDFDDFDDAKGLAEHAHEHKPGDPLRTWAAVGSGDRSEPIDLDEAQRLCDAATPGPWEVEWEVEYDSCDCDQPCGHGPFAARIRGVFDVEPAANGTCKNADVEFAAEARALLPRLVAEVRAAREVVEALREWKDGPLRDTYDPEFDYGGFAVDCLDAYDEAMGGGS